MSVVDVNDRVYGDCDASWGHAERSGASNDSRDKHEVHFALCLEVEKDLERFGVCELVDRVLVGGVMAM